MTVDCSVVVPVAADCVGKTKLVGHFTELLVQIQTRIKD